MTHEQKEKIMQLSNALAKQLAALEDDSEYRQWMSYFFECVETEHEITGGEDALQFTAEILEERLANGRW